MSGVPAPSRAAASPDDLIGSLKIVSLLDICQFLLLNKKSGTLTLFARGGVSRIFFDGGSIVNAVSEGPGREGRDVALSLFRLREGGFRFRQEEVHERKRIEGSTENLLLDAAKRMDEIEEALPGAAALEGTSRQQELKEKQEHAEALRELFSSLEEDLTCGSKAPALEKMLAVAGKAGGDAIVLAEGKFPYVLQGGRVLRALPGRITTEDLEQVAAAATADGEIRSPGGTYRLSRTPNERTICLRKTGAGEAVEASFPAKALEGLIGRAPGVILLAGNSHVARRVLLATATRILGERGEVVLFIGGGSGEERKSLFLDLPLPEGETESARLLRRLSAFPGARVLLPEIRSRGEALFLLDLARSGHGVIAPLPGMEGGDALRRARSWFREDRSLDGLASLLTGVASLILYPLASHRFVPLTSVAPWTQEASHALRREDPAALARALERAAGTFGLTPSLEGLRTSGAIEKSEAMKIASLLSSLLKSAGPPPPAGNPG